MVWGFFETEELALWKPYEVEKSVRKKKRIYTGSEDKTESSGEEEWFYDCGPRRFIYTLRFVDSKLVQIIKGGYGTSKGLPCPSSVWEERKKLAQ